MNTGILGGTFNPIHLSHLYLAREYQEVLGLDRILFIPTHTPPHKRPADLADAAHRLEMCRLATAETPDFEVCAYEVEQQDISYTYKTLEHLRRIYPDDTFYLLMGADMFLSIQEWKQPQRIWNQAVLCAAARREGELERLLCHKDLLRDRGVESRVLPMRPKPLSSTEIRQRIGRGEDAADVLPAPVWDYIREHHLYAPGGTASRD